AIFSRSLHAALPICPLSECQAAGTSPTPSGDDVRYKGCASSLGNSCIRAFRVGQIYVLTTARRRADPLLRPGRHGLARAEYCCRLGPFPPNGAGRSELRARPFWEERT